MSVELLTKSTKAREPNLYTSHTLHSLPHLWRVRKAIEVLKGLSPPGSTYADVGCGDGFVTSQIAGAIRAKDPIGYDFNDEALQIGERQFPSIRFRQWNLSAENPPAVKYDLVTCMESLEHVLDLRRSVENLIPIVGSHLLITVPIETGPIGLAKFSAKTILGKETFNGEHLGSRFDYFCRLLRGASVSQFRHNPIHGCWNLHTGFDYRELDNILREYKVKITIQNHGWNRFYIVNCHARTI